MVLEWYEREEREMFKGLRVCKSSSTGGVLLASAIINILQAGYPLQVDSVSFSYFHTEEGCYVYAGTLDQIRSLTLSPSVLYQGTRLTIRARPPAAKI